tara:strand:- start:858 stop:1718 length:861 start_codon:yes stop_codon:yes gene_type:complete
MNERYKSILVIGHIFPLYDIFGDLEEGNKEKVNYLNPDNLRVLSDEIYKLENVEQVVLLGDTYVNDSKSIYELVNNELIDKINSPVTKVLGNHEVHNLGKFRDSGGVEKGFFDINNFRVLFYSPWRLIDGLPKMSVSKKDIEFFNNNLDYSKNNIVLVTDMVHHNKSDLTEWKSSIVPILKKFNVKFVVVGDSDLVGHRYSWVEVDDIKYIHQGIAQNYHFPNINTFLEIQIHEEGGINFIPHTLPFDGLSEVYESSIVDYIKKPELGFFQKFYRLLIKSYYYIFS